MKLKVKGINDGLLMTLPNASWEECCEDVRETIGENAAFYTGANLFLDAGDMDVRVVEITSLRSELEKLGVALKGIFSRSEKTMQNCRSLGLATEAAVSKKKFRREEIEEPQHALEIGEPAYLIGKTVRSGVSVAREEPIVILGDVNPGAEIGSAKSVVVLGTIRGRVSAGSEADTGAYVAAMDFENAQVVVNGVLRLIEKVEKKKNHSGLFVVRNKFGEIEIES